VIKSIRNKQTQQVWDRINTPRLAPDLQRRARKKLVQIDAATCLDDLRIPPGNRLEALRGDRSGQFSVRINDQFRICFTWSNDSAEDVEIVDYHQREDVAK
jgi:proteic killer suppression protein